MKICKDLVQVDINKQLVSFNLKDSYLYILGKYGIHFLLINDLLFIKTLENSLFYNQLLGRKTLINKIINLKIKGSSIGWFTELQLIGLGFRVKLISINYLLLNLGYSHVFGILIPKGLNILINKDRILLFSLNLILLGNFVNKLIKLRSPDVYKGKGIKILLKNIKLKEGKKQKL